MGWDQDGEVVFGLVCARHERELGRKNMVKFCGMTLEDVLKWEHKEWKKGER